MNMVEIVTGNVQDDGIYARIAYDAAWNLIMHNGHTEEHLGITNDLPILLQKAVSLQLPCHRSP